MSEFLGDDEEREQTIQTIQPLQSQPTTYQFQSRFSNAIEIERWYGERLSIAEAEYKIIKQEAARSTKALIWQRLQEKWECEFSNLRAELSREITMCEGQLLNDISAFENFLQNRTDGWKFCPENWSTLKDWRRELQALQKCEAMRQRSL